MKWESYAAGSTSGPGYDLRTTETIPPRRDDEPALRRYAECAVVKAAGQSNTNAIPTRR
jgi:hypothetical protein